MLKMKVLVYLVLFVGLTAGASVETPMKAKHVVPRLTDTRIVGGEEVDISQYAHQITMRFKNIFFPDFAYSHRCGGSIYKDNVIITAAHCIIGTVPSQHKIVAGTNHRLGSDGIIAPVKDIIMHEDYDPDTFDNDIAIMILAERLPLNNYTIKAIELADSNPASGARATITGWGALQEGSFSPNTLQAVHVPIVSNDICDEDYGGGMILPSMVCAGLRGTGGKDACQGDSGGPLLVGGKLAGVVSWGYGCARPQWPGVYANVAHLREWILKTLADLEE